MKPKNIFTLSLLLLFCTIMSIKSYSQSIVLAGSCMLITEKDHPYIETGYFALDSNGNNVTALVTIYGSVDETTPGVYYLYYDLPDSIAQIDSVVRVILVEDQPYISGDSMIVTTEVYTPDNVVSAYISYIEQTLGLDATISGAANYEKIGSYPMTLSIANPLDPNCEQTINIMVNVVDDMAPVMALFGEDPFYTCTSIPYLEPGYVVSDNYWSHEDITVSIFADFKLDSLYPAIGTYTIKYVATDGSGNMSDTLKRYVYVTVCDGVDEIGTGLEFSIFPNPSSEWIRISQQTSSEQIVSLTVYDMTGKEIKTLKTPKQSDAEIKVNDLANGIYLLQIKTESNTYSKKFQVAR